MHAREVEMTSKKSVLGAQSAWAEKAGLTLDANGYFASWQENLHQPLSAHAHIAFRGGSGNELEDSDGRAAKMRAAHSSSALVVNVFDYWSVNADRVLSALGLKAGGESVAFEAQFSTGLGGNPPNLDICVRRTGGALVGVESKFTEWLFAKSASKEHFKDKYFPSDGKLWEGLGLRATQKVAEDIHARAKTFRYLDAPQLLKHALGLANTKQPFELYYLYYDVPGRESQAHRSEIDDFASRVAEDFPFHVGTYQEVYARIRAQAADCDAAYLAYLDARYFG
jgi:hypothetical protein